MNPEIDLARTLPFREVHDLLGLVAGALFTALYLRALCFGAPPLRQLTIAALRVVALPALAILFSRFTPTPLPSWLPLLLGLPGLILAIGPLRGHVRAPSPSPRRGGLLTALLVLAHSAAAVGGYQSRFHATALEEEQTAIASAQTDQPPLFEALPPRELDLGAGVVAKGPYRNMAVTLTATPMDPGSILQVRLRSPNPAWPFGVSFFLSTDPRFESGFFEETKVRFSRLGSGSGSGSAEPGRTVALTLETSGRVFVASVDGVEVARATDRRYAQGSVLVLAARGRVEVEGVRVTPVPLDEPTVSAARDRTLGASAALAVAALLSLLGAWLIRVGMPRALELFSFGLAPVALFLFTASPRDPLDAVGLAVHLFVASALLLVVPLVHRERVTGPRYAVWAAVVVAAAFAAFVHGRARAWPADFQEENALSVVDWDGDRQEADLLDLTHPALRRWNNYLGDHTLRLLKHDRARPEGKARVVAIGTSSTHGYWLKLPYAYRLHLLLEAAGRPVETLIAAVPGATGPRLYWFARNVVMRYRPDVVTLSLTYNDAYALTQFDEREYLARITAPGYHRGWFDRLRDRLAVVVGGAYLRGCLDEFARTRTVTLRDGAPDPPARFEAMLDDFARLCAEHGAALVLVKEPIAGGVTRLWKAEFYAAIDRVAARHGLGVVDPTPTLNEHGGASLFMDQVHPLADGAQRIAESMLPAVSEALERRGE